MTSKNICLLFALTISLPAISQVTDGKNMGKINLSAFALKGFSLQYERQVASRMTVALGYSKIPTSNIPFKSYIERQINNPDVKVGDFHLGTSIFTPEIRYYFGKDGAFHGFYIAPYARIGSYNIDGPIEYTSSTNTPRTAVFDGKLNTITGGLMIGSSFSLSSKLYLDWWIIGASIGGANGDLTAMTPLSKSEQSSLQDNLNNLNVPFTKVASHVNERGATVTTTGSMVGLRGLGINLGFRF
jgi:Protein of unknown function (DUF3575)